MVRIVRRSVWFSNLKSAGSTKRVPSYMSIHKVIVHLLCELGALAEPDFAK